MNILDRAIAAVAPRYAARRQVARIQLEQLARIAPRPQTRRRPDEWRLNDPSTRRWEAQQLRPMNRYDRRQLRYLFETNPFAVKTKASILNNLVGYGITGTVKGSKTVQNLWKEWIKVCDYDGVYDLYGLQALIADIWLDDGEVFIVERVVPGAAVHPLRLQVLDADQLDTTSAIGIAAGTIIRDGIEYDLQTGRPVAYHFRQNRELEAYREPIRVPAEEVIHLFHRKRAGQWRGRPLFESVLDVLTDVDEYLEAEGIRKKISACFVGFRAPSIEGEDPAMGTVEPSQDPVEPPAESFFPGMIINGRPGEQMTFGDPKADAGISDYMRWGGLRMAAGSQTTYERATGDLSNVNYSSYKAGDLEFQRFIGRLQWLLFIPRLLNRIDGAFVDIGFKTGLINSRLPQFKWTPPPFGSVDEGKDILAKRNQMAAGVESLRNVAAERGYDLDDLSDEIAADLKMLEAKGLLALVAAMFTPPNQAGGPNAPSAPKAGG